MMWNWYTEQTRALKSIRLKSVSSGDGEDIQLVAQDDGTVSVISNSPLDYMRLIVHTESNSEQVVSGTGSTYWTTENTGVALTRSIDNTYFEIAAGTLSPTPPVITDPYPVATLAFSNNLMTDDTITVAYRIRRFGEKDISEGTAVLNIEDMPSPVPAEFSLMQNMPNPFNPSTVISFTLPQDGHVRLSIYTIEGKLVTVLVDDFVNSGYHTYTWDARNMPSGMYFYSLKTGGFSGSKKMMLLK
jgi:hypothetical protein